MSHCQCSRKPCTSDLLSQYPCSSYDTQFFPSVQRRALPQQPFVCVNDFNNTRPPWYKHATCARNTCACVYITTHPEARTHLHRYQQWELCIRIWALW